MSLDTPVAVVLAILFLIPGFLWKMIADSTSPYVTRRDTSLLQYLALSCLNYLLALPVIYLLIVYGPTDLSALKQGGIRDNKSYIMAWLSLVFVLPVLGGYVSQRLVWFFAGSGFAKKLGIWIVHPAPTAWDYVFARDQPYWARIELTDGKLIEGVFDSNSLASSEVEDRDIFLETVFELDEETQDYRQVDRNAGILVRGQSIKTIAFFNIESNDERE